MKARGIRRVVVAGGAGLLLLVTPSPVLAHRTSLQAPLVPVVGSVSPIVLSQPGQITFTPLRGGQIKFRLSRATDGTGHVITASGNTLELDLVVNGVPRLETVPFDIRAGRARGVIPSLNLVRQDLVEVKRVELRDSGGARFGALGVQAPRPSLASSLIRVAGSPSAFQLSPMGGAEVKLSPAGGGALTVRHRYPTTSRMSAARSCSKASRTRARTIVPPPTAGP